MRFRMIRDFCRRTGYRYRLGFWTLVFLCPSLFTGCYWPGSIKPETRVAGLRADRSVLLVPKSFSFSGNSIPPGLYPPSFQAGPRVYYAAPTSLIRKHPLWQFKSMVDGGISLGTRSTPPDAAMWWWEPGSGYTSLMIPKDFPFALGEIRASPVGTPERRKR